MRPSTTPARPPDRGGLAGATDDLRARLEAYYTPLYRDDLGYGDWEAHVAKRLDEDANFARLLAGLESDLLLDRWRPPGRLLVVGSGTGADWLTFARRGFDAWGIEPNEEALEISRLKARQEGRDGSRLVHAAAENLPFPGGMFDRVWSWTVLEHVQDAERSLSEIVRVLRPGGEAFVGTVDYRQFWEPHYKTYAPCFLPRPFVKLWLRLAGRHPGFVDSLNFVSGRRLANALRSHPVTAWNAIRPWTGRLVNPASPEDALIRWITETFQADSVQLWVIRKHAAPARTAN